MYYSNRQQFVFSLFQFLEDKKYALLKHRGLSYADFSDNSDVDLLIEEENLSKIQRFIASYRSITKNTVHRLHDATHHYLFFKDGSFLQLDLLTKLICRGRVYMPTELIWNNIETRNGIKQYTYELLFEHALLYYHLNLAPIPNKYLDLFIKLPVETQKSIQTHLQTKFHLSCAFTQLNAQAKVILPSIKKVIHSYAENNFKNLISNKYLYFKQTLTSRTSARGKIFTFSGVDGAGKSTIINELKLVLENKLHKNVIVLRHRPSILPIINALFVGKMTAEQRAVSTLPRMGTNNSSLSSLLRFFYYLADYLIGQGYVYFKYISRDYIVLYDRYYFDFIVDAKRSNILLPKNLVRFFYRFVQKADANFFLYASAELTRNRKNELDLETIQRLNDNYLFEFSRLSSLDYKHRYLSIQNTNKQHTIESIFNVIKYCI